MPSTPVPRDPSLKRSTRARFWLAWLLRHYLGSERFRGLRRRIEAEILEQSLPAGPGAVRQVPRVRAADLSPEQFHREFLKAHTPVVIEGFAEHWTAVRRWTPEVLRQEHGDAPLPVRIRADEISDTRYRWDTLGEVMGEILDGGPAGVTGVDDVFNRSPRLRAELDLDAVAELIAPPGGARGAGGRLIPDIFSTQLFVGSGRTFTAWHCAVANNLFVLVHGRKRWSFIDPRYTPWLYPEVDGRVHYHLCNVDYRAEPEERRAAGHELYDFAPKWEAELGPGDAIFSPQWWWHRVENEGVTLAVACRALTDLMHGSAPFTWVGGLSWTALRFFLALKREGWATDRLNIHPADEFEGPARPR